MPMDSTQRRNAARIDKCDQCGVPHRDPAGRPQCVGHRAKRPKERCKRFPVDGATVCTTHGGRAPQVKEGALQRIRFAETEGEIAAMMKACDLPDQHPLDGLLEVVRHSGAMARLLAHLVGGLKTHPTFDSFVTEGKDGTSRVEKVASNDALYGLNHAGDEAPSVMVALYEKWLTLYSKACKMALDANIDERLVRNAESTSDTMLKAFADALESGNLTSSQREAIVVSFTDSLTRYTGPLEIKR